MNELVKVVEQNGKQLINARDLHEALGVKSQFTQWINNRIKDYGYAEGEDFFSSPGESTGGRPQHEYMLTMPAAMMLASSNNSKGGFKLLKWLTQTVEASNEPDRVIERAARMTGDKVKHYGTALGRFIKLAEKLAKDKKYALVLKPLIIAAYDLAAVLDSVVIESDFVRRGIGVLMQHYELDTETLRDLVFDIREKIGWKAFYELSEKYESGIRKQLTA